MIFAIRKLPKGYEVRDLDNHTIHFARDRRAAERHIKRNGGTVADTEKQAAVIDNGMASLVQKLNEDAKLLAE